MNYYDEYNFEGDGSQHYDNYFLTNLSDEALRTVKGQLTATKTIDEDQAATLDVFFYDKYYRLLQTCTWDELNGVYYHTGNDYSFGGHVTQTNKRFSMPGHPLLFYTFEFDYDHDWRLVSTTLNINNEPEHNVLNYLEYFETSLPGTKHLHGDSQNSMYSWQHSYNPRGWLTALNSNTPAQLFNLELFYDELPGEAGSYASSQYNGNIGAMHWSTQGIEGKMGAYAFEYDNLNRLTDATYYYKDASNNLHYCLSGGSNPVDSKRAIIGIGSVFDIGYDKNGNIDSLTRIGRQQGGWLTFDKLTYTYDTSYFPNRLKAVDDEISGQNNLGDFHDNGYEYHQHGQAEYLYDPNGNMTSDLNRSLTLEYALGTNLPERIIHSGGHIRNYYTPAGRKTGKKVFDASNNLLSQELYYGDLIVKDGRATRILHGDGVVNLSSGPPEFDYHIKDHLGNVRLVIEPDASNNPVVLQANDYYPFGMSYSTAPGVNKYLYNSKEEQEMPGKWLDYGFRFYDPQLARFHTLDVLAETYSFQSPYAYAANNPIRYIDWMGLGPGDRIKIAQSMLGTHYKQEKTKALRTGSDDAALAYMDCSEFVSRVLAGDGITDGVLWMTSGQMVSMFSDTDNFLQSTTPQAGDIVAWDGHAGVVESYNEDSKAVNVLHATSYTSGDGTKVEGAVREEYSTSYYEGKGAGFYRPKVETPDVIGKTFSGGQIEGVTVTAEATYSLEPIRPLQIQVTQ